MKLNRHSYVIMSNLKWIEKYIFEFMKFHNMKLLIKLIWNWNI